MVNKKVIIYLKILELRFLVNVTAKILDIIQTHKKPSQNVP